MYTTNTLYQIRWSYVKVIYFTACIIKYLSVYITEGVSKHLQLQQQLNNRQKQLTCEKNVIRDLVYMDSSRLKRYATSPTLVPYFKKHHPCTNTCPMDINHYSKPYIILRVQCCGIFSSPQSAMSQWWRETFPRSCNTTSNEIVVDSTQYASSKRARGIFGKINNCVPSIYGWLYVIKVYR